MNLKLRSILRAALSSHHYFSGLPYNLGWIERLPIPIEQALCSNPIIVYDFGARYSVIPELVALEPVITYIGFDADEDECKKLTSEPSRFKSRNILPYYVGDTDALVEFHITVEPGCSSSFRPSERFARLFAAPGQADIQRTTRVRSRRLSEIVELEHLPLPDLIKIDTQGSELGILHGAGDLIGRVPLIEVEMEFIEQYENQPLFFDVARLLYERGYELTYLNRMMKQRSNVYSGSARGQLLFGDGLFVLKESCWSRLPDEQLERFCILLWAYGHRDIGYQLLSERLSNRVISKHLRALFNQRIRYGSRIGRAIQFVIGKLDLAVLAWLALRRTNGLRSEADRSWPIR